MKATGRPRVRTGILLAAFFAAALALRLTPFTAATAGGLRLLSPDCYGHLRRSASVARNFPRVPVFDPWLNHPDGGVFIWPPLFDLAVGGSARLLLGQGVTMDQVAWVAASVPPLLGALHVFPLFSLCLRVLGRRRALLATGIYAVLPSAAIWSSFGHADHHVLEVLVLLLFLDAAAAMAEASGERRARAALLAGAFLGIALLTWQGAVAFAGLAYPWALVAAGPAAVLLGTAASSVSALGTWATLGGERVPFAFISFGWFQPLLLAAATIPLAVYGAVRAKGVRRIGACVLLLLLLVVSLPYAGPILSAVWRGGAHLVNREAAAGSDFDGRGYISYPASFLGVVAELQPLLAPPRLPNAVRAVEELSLGLVFLPLALALWSRPLLRSRAPRHLARLLIVLFGAALLLMTLMQRRNSYYLAVFTSIALAEAVARLSLRLRVRREGAAILLALGLVVVPGIPPLRLMASYRQAPGPDFLDLLRRLAAADPVGVDPSALPPPAPGALEGVFNPWAAGHFVTALTGRPAAADPNVYGWLRQCRLFTATDDAEALRILLDSRCRYLLTADLRPVLRAYAAAAGRPETAPVDEMFAVRIHESARSEPVPFLELFLQSRTGYRAPGGRLVPAFRIWKVISPTEAGAVSAPVPAGR